MFVKLSLLVVLFVLTPALADTLQRSPEPREIIGGNAVDHYEDPYTSVV